MLNKTIFSEGLKRFIDEDASSFSGFPKTKQEAAEKWGTAFSDYASAVVPPSTTSSAAKASFIATFLTVSDDNGYTVLPKCFHDYALALALGMNPTFTGTAPVTPPNLKAVFDSGFSGASSSQCISTLVDIIDTWLKTGKAVNNSSGVTIPWS